ncbi:Undecaprenyl-phosphate mannosyltransferase [Rosistilla carotiformis]|uniref:Undecaprenyl-phosphate mannosyltransferase n=1 Tax=Rosistilla carotiformis TaxID=2528017 RepID=A0A518JZQ2_9BACT|nr:polyprenol monophosphomannose synthase [Rosistilla carotiformis]QDV71024.1 Undecaprenyl-phosphate mannosyltransferase [Rosistilla carotiformis]
MTHSPHMDEHGSVPAARVLVAVCTYNELDSLPELVAGIRAALPSADVLVVDDGSPDGTGDWAADKAVRDPWFTLIQRGRKLGLGSAIVAAMRHASDSGYDFLVNLDGDMSHDPVEIPKLVDVACREQADVVIGSRYVPGGAIEGWPMSRLVISGLLNRVARIALGLQAHDCSGAYRCYRVDTLDKVDLNRIRASGYAMLEEILWLLTHRDAKIVEIPIRFVNRVQGSSKLSLGEAVKSIAMLARIACSPRR